MCDPLTAVVAGAAILGGGTAAIQGSKNRKAQARANAQNERMAQQQAQRSEEQFNRANKKLPGIEALMAGNKVATSKGIGSTFLTGAGGVKNNALGGAPSLLGS